MLCAVAVSLALLSLRPGDQMIARAQAPAPAQLPQPAAPAFVPNEVIVQFRRDVAPLARANAQDAVRDSLGIVQSLVVSDVELGLELLTVSVSVADAVAALQALPEVEFAEPNWIVYRDATPNDPLYVNGSLWGTYSSSTSPANPFGSQAGRLWARGFTGWPSNGESTGYVGIIDTGVEVNHPDLSQNIWSNPFESFDRVDNDGNGFVDDLVGWDFCNNDNSVYDGTFDDHGTHVAGTIGARGGNGMGVVGMAWHVSLISAKVLCPSGTITRIVNALDYFTNLNKRHDMDIVAINMSLGTYDRSTSLHQALIRAAKQDILIVASAGNDACDTDAVPHYPSGFRTDVNAGSATSAGYNAVISVANITRTGVLLRDSRLAPCTRFAGSNYGATTVHVGAPGTAIWSTWPGGYASASGTSMAAPHVTGAAALYKAMNGDAGAEHIRSIMLREALPTSSLAGRTATGARLNVGDFASLPAVSVGDVSVIEGGSGTTTTARFPVTLEAANISPVTVTYTTANDTASDGTFANPATITINRIGTASPYPSTITIPTGLGVVTKVTVTLHGFTHEDPGEVDILLVAPPRGVQVQAAAPPPFCEIMSDAANSQRARNVTLTFDDNAAGVFPISGIGFDLLSGTYQTTDGADLAADVYPSPAPSAAYNEPPRACLGNFVGADPAGQWRLFVVDDAAAIATPSLGFISGWSMRLTTTATDYVATSGSVTIPAGSTTAVIPITVNGDWFIEPSETFVVKLVKSRNARIGDGIAIGTIRTDDLFTDHPLSAGASIRAIHIVELRSHINAARAARGLSAFSFTDPTLTIQSTSVRAVHITELRTAISEAYVAAGLAPRRYTDPVLTPGITTAKAAHIAELRDAVLNLP